ncbi:uncharacterized protein LOC127418195 isoform X2 [Myxocyprinus asiaticus]|uniref:uncharacterized protein LOC127418195 isoform X2 n=1 Tax=Myxocyprinus asiaticus TaxID=70543 RepID=UPI002221C066|nr:uncharacterized protein LOC127418195 isoform X2 [Myxocyprinus asiaticus]
MPNSSDVMIASAVYQQQQCAVSKFLKIKQMVFGVLEILTALVGLGFTSWQIFWFLSLSSVFFILTGVVTVSAACIRKPCLVKFAQILNYINIAAAATSLRINFILRWPRSTMVSYMNTNLPVNNIVFVGQLDPSALPQPGSSVLYMMPANYGPVPTAPPANFNQLPTSPPPAYEACVLSTPETRTRR